MSVALIRLQCGHCRAGLPASENDSLFVCTMCGRGYELRGGALEEIPLAYAMPEAAHTERPLYLPFWWYRISLGFSSSTPPPDPSRPERMKNVYVTAFAVRGFPFSDDPGFLFTQRQVAPRVKTTLREPTLGGTITSARARCWVPLTLLSLADRAGEDLPETGAPTSFKLARTSEPLEERLLAVPFYDEGVHLVDGLLGGRYPKDAIADARLIEAEWKMIKEAKDKAT
ncbi:MAG: hypothetical protein JSV08_03840 [Acidobacteriota bacterium]|nr:MAG: hypothetical protein JSV08_03840 [Acidobacteriota bacterium]